MTFIEWYERSQGSKWNEVFSKIQVEQVVKVTIEYEVFCHAEDIEPVWDGYFKAS